jgi:hypothetical protein
MPTGGRATHGGGPPRPQTQPPRRPPGTPPAVHGTRSGPRRHRSWTTPWSARHWWCSSVGGAHRARPRLGIKCVKEERWDGGRQGDLGGEGDGSRSSRRPAGTPPTVHGTRAGPRRRRSWTAPWSARHWWCSSAGGAHRSRPRLGINAWKKSGGMGAAARGSERRGGWFVKQLGNSHEILSKKKSHKIVPLYREEDSREGSGASSPAARPAHLMTIRRLKSC